MTTHKQPCHFVSIQILIVRQGGRLGRVSNSCVTHVVKEKKNLSTSE